VSTITKDEVLAVLEEVHDAHVPASLRSMGMLSDVRINDGNVYVEVCIPCMACPAASHLTNQIRDRLLAVDGVESVEVETGYHLYWDREAVDEQTRALMRANGIQI
jgi:metal-sulfur cluster biosynthetic enzyme